METVLDIAALVADIAQLGLELGARHLRVGDVADARAGLDRLPCAVAADVRLVQLKRPAPAAHGEAARHRLQRVEYGLEDHLHHGRHGGRHGRRHREDSRVPGIA